MGFYTSWGYQASFTDRLCATPDVYVETLGTSRFVARCRACDWRTRICGTGEAAAALADGHVGRDAPTTRAIRNTREVRTGLGIDRWPTRAPTWARALVGVSTEALDDLSRANDLIEAALRGDASAPVEPIPEDTGGLDLAALHAGWAARASDAELEEAEHWVENRPSVAELPLRPGFVPDLYRFLIRRAQVQFRDHEEGRFAVVPSGFLQDAGYVAKLELSRRRRESVSARWQLRMIVAGLRSKYGGPVSNDEQTSLTA